MQDRKLMALIGAVGEAQDLDSASLRIARDAGCLSMSRLSALAASAVQPDAGEAAHLAQCAVCRARLGIFRESRGPVSAPSAEISGVAVHGRARRPAPLWLQWERFAVAVTAAAACVGVFMVPHGVHRTGTLGGRTGPSHVVRSIVCTPCDANCDGVLNVRDIDAFILAVIYPGEYSMDFPRCDILCSTDGNRNCRLDEEDLDSVVACVTPRRFD